MSNNFTPLVLPQNIEEQPKKKDTFLVLLMGTSAVLLAVLGTIVALLFTGSYKGPMSAKASSVKTTDVTISAKPSVYPQLTPTPTISFEEEPNMLEEELDTISLDADTTPTELPVEPSLDTLVE